MEGDYCKIDDPCNNRRNGRYRRETKMQTLPVITIIMGAVAVGCLVAAYVLVRMFLRALEDYKTQAEAKSIKLGRKSGGARAD
jgi:hypothetical protein